VKIDSLREKTKVEYKDRFKDQGAEGYSKKSSSVLNTLPKNTLAQDSVSKQWFLFWQISVNQSRIKSRREIKAKSLGLLQLPPDLLPPGGAEDADLLPGHGLAALLHGHRGQGGHVRQRLLSCHGGVAQHLKCCLLVVVGGFHVQRLGSLWWSSEMRNFLLNSTKPNLIFSWQLEICRETVSAN